MNYQPEVCECCGQTKTYLLPIDRGTTDILKAISVAIRKIGRNEVHPRSQMEVAKQIDYATMVKEGLLTSNQVGNLSRARMHGLIASVDGKRGYYCLTRKGSQFLHGESVQRLAIISKAKGHQMGYFDEFTDRVTLNSFKPDREYWSGINFRIENGQIIYDDIPQEIRRPMTINLFNYKPV